MADKEATVYILDLGSSMAECHSGRSESNLDWSMRYVWDKISTTVAASRKTWNVGMLGVRTDTTSSPMQKEDGYENIAVLQDLGPMDLQKMRNLQTLIRPNKTDNGDCISAIIIAIDMIEKFTKKLKYNRRIILVTDGEAPVDPDDFSDIATRIKDDKIDLVVLGVDFDDPDFGFKEEDKTKQKATNEKYMRSLVDLCDGQFGTIAEAIAELDVPRLKTTRAYKTYDGPLTLGNPEDNENAMSIPVERYFKTKKATAPTASNVVVKSEDADGTQTTQTLEGDEMEGVEATGGAFAAVKNARTYKVNDPEAPGGKRDVEFESLAKGYTYGQTAVHISESEWNITKIETVKSFSILGFIQWDKYQAFLNMGESCMTVAQKYNEAAALKLSSLIHSLHELESYAVARLVIKGGKDPALVLLAPHIEPDLECLYDIPLPFAEDVRHYPFPPLDKVITVSGATLTTHRHLPSQDLLETMSEYVDAMDISTYGQDDDGNRNLEYAPVDDVFSPQLHRINQIVRHRAVYPDQPLPSIAPILVRYAQPDIELVDQARSRLEDLIETAEVKKVPPKAKGKRLKESVKPISGLDVDALLRQPENKRKKIDANNAVPDFKQMAENAESEVKMEEAVKQMGTIVRELVTDSMADNNYNRVIENIGVMREEMIELEEPVFFNTFLTDFKKRLLSGELGGDRRELWWQIKGAKLGLIDSNASEVSKVTPEQAAEFLKK